MYECSPLFICVFLFVTSCSVSTPAGRDDRNSFPSRFVIDKGSDLKETVSGNLFVVDLPGVHPVFGRALTVRVRGVKAESIKDKDPANAALAYRQRLRFKRLLDDAEMVELRNLERGQGDGVFWVWADLYLNGRILLLPKG